MRIKRVGAEQIRELRHKTLRQGKPFSTTSYLRDNEKETFHLACFVKNEIVSCATFYPEKLEKTKARKAFRLRGMATKENYRKRGCGKEIMKKAFTEIREKGGDLIWCNARLVAVGFYKKLGMQTTGEMFDISDIGPHYLMYRSI